VWQKPHPALNPANPTHGGDGAVTIFTATVGATINPTGTLRSFPMVVRKIGRVAASVMSSAVGPAGASAMLTDTPGDGVVVSVRVICALSTETPAAARPETTALRISLSCQSSLSAL